LLGRDGARQNRDGENRAEKTNPLHVPLPLTALKDKPDFARGHRVSAELQRNSCTDWRARGD
jgi:hypothetical protein